MKMSAMKWRFINSSDLYKQMRGIVVVTYNHVNLIKLVLLAGNGEY